MSTKANPTSYKALGKAVRKEGMWATARKRDGWHSRYTGCMSFVCNTPFPKPVASIAKCMSCTNPPCDKIEPPECISENTKLRFQACGMCHTPYCSRECQAADFNRHKAFCHSFDAFDGRLEEWRESHEAVDAPGFMFKSLKDELKEFEASLGTEGYEKLLKWVGYTRETLLEAYYPSH